MDAKASSLRDSDNGVETPQGFRTQSADGEKRADGPSVYIHDGGHDQIPADAPSALQFLKSYTGLVDAPNTPLRASHIGPRATIRINGGPPAPMDRLATVLDARSKMIPAMHCEHTLRRVWAISETIPTGPRETLLIHWEASATHLTHGSTDGFDSFDRTEQSKFTILELEQAPPGEGVHGLWVVRSNNWMDEPLHQRVQEKVMLAVTKSVYPQLTLEGIVSKVEADPSARDKLFGFFSSGVSRCKETSEEEAFPDIKREQESDSDEEEGFYDRHTFQEQELTMLTEHFQPRGSVLALLNI